MTCDPVRHRVLLARLHEADLEVEGLLSEASNVTVRAWLGAESPSTVRERVVYKPVRGARPLHDFDARTLAAREVAAYRVSRAGGWHVVPPTVLRDGPLGIGSVQWWVDGPASLGAATPDQEVDQQVEASESLLDLFGPRQVPAGWRTVVRAQDESGRPLVVAHADRSDLRSLAVLDAVLNNADRKGAHLVLDGAGRVWAVDHGLCFHTQDKLRTVLWGWAGEPLAPGDLARLQALDTQLADGSLLRADLDALLDPDEVLVLRVRIARLLRDGALPVPPSTRYPLPWPIW